MTSCKLLMAKKLSVALLKQWISTKIGSDLYLMLEAIAQI